MPTYSVVEVQLIRSGLTHIKMQQQKLSTNHNPVNSDPDSNSMPVLIPSLSPPPLYPPQVTDEDVAAIEEMGRQGGLFERLAASIAPEIYGMLEVKKVRRANGGVHK